MKNLKKMLALVLTLVLALSLAIPAFAAETGSITVKPKDNGDHTFTAYQIFAGELSASGVLSNVTWGSAITDDGAALIEQLAEDVVYVSYFENCTTAATVAEALDALIAAEGEEVAAQVLTAALEKVELSNGKVLEKSDDGNYKAIDLDMGYYVVTDSVAEGTTGAKASDMIVRVVGNVVVDAKADIPQVTKEADGVSYGIGDEIGYTLTATVPDYNENPEEVENYAYELTFEDTMDPELDLIYTYVANASEPTGGIQVMMDEKDVTGSFTITYDTTAHKLIVSCEDITQIADVTKDSVFTVTYKASINSTYEAGKVENRVTLITKDYQSTEITENVFPISLEVVKVDGSSKNVDGIYETLLDGAKFTLQNEEGLYLQVNDEGKVLGWVDEDHASELVTDEDGRIKVVGLAAGTYTLTETKAPEGYNLPDSSFTLVINATENALGDALETLTISVDGGIAQNGVDGTVTATIENNKGAQLPSTGGIGTTIFYVVGAILVIGAGVLLITKKRMSNAQ